MQHWLTRFRDRCFSPSLGRKPVCFVFFIAFLLSFTFYVEQVRRRDGLNSVPLAGDAVEYDCIAVQIVQGNGVSIDYQDPQFQTPYLETEGHEDVYGHLETEVHGATTMRPPGLPLIMAGVYASAGRRFAIIRIMNCTAMALAVCLALSLAYRSGGIIAAAVGLFCATVVDSARPYLYGNILTEPSAALALVIVFLLQLHYVRKPVVRTALGLGVALGLAMYLRTAFVLWLPPLLLAMLIPLTDQLRELPWRRRFAGAFATVLALGICLAPWGLRNSLLLDEFKPLGLHGEVNLGVAYSDRALRTGGLWYNQTTESPELVEFLPELAYERELYLASQGRRDAAGWLSTNWRDVPQLMTQRVLTEWWPTSRREILLLMLCAVGLAVYPRRDEQRLIACYLIAASFAVAASWSVGGRFLVPVRPLLYVCAGVAVAIPVKQWLGWVQANAMRDQRS